MGENEPSYEVIVSDRAAIDEDRIQQSLLLRDPNYAADWLKGYVERLQSLRTDPRLHPAAREEALFGRETRRLLYYGPGGRQGRNRPAWRVLYTIIEPMENEARGTVSILRVLHSGQDILAPATDEDN